MSASVLSGIVLTAMVVIGATAQSVAADTASPTPSDQRAPNIVIVILDDIGFADTSTFGGLALTPELSRLAAHGLRFNNFHAVGECAPTRAALLSGRNHHRVGFGAIPEKAAPFPGYDTVWKKNAASMAEILRRNGYSTAAFGKWHNTPTWEVSPIGPFDRWPTGLGFEYFYGFMAGMVSQWEPTSLYRGTTAVEAPAATQAAYHLTTDITDEAIAWLRTHESLAPAKPYFLYFAPGAVHGPHHVPEEWVQRYRGKFDRGWDALRKEIFARQRRLGVIPSDAQLTPRPMEIPAWNSLSADQKKLYGRQMEVYAGFIAHTDHEVGRLLRIIEAGPDAAHTLIFFIAGDNGSAVVGHHGFTETHTSVLEQLPYIDALGSRTVAFNFYAAGWGWLGSTPFKGWKLQASHLGALRVPLVVSYPARIKDPGVLRTQFTHINDIAATVYDVTGVRAPAVIDGVDQQPLDGRSFAAAFESATAISNHRTQYFEIRGHRAIYDDGWVAAARHQPPGSKGPDRWELYHVAKDFSEARDLAATRPKKLHELQQLFETEARNNGVEPLAAAERAPSLDRPSWAESRKTLVYYPDTQRVPVVRTPQFLGNSYQIRAQGTIPPLGAEGVIVAYGGRIGGFALYMKGGRIYYENNSGQGPNEIIAWRATLPPGRFDLVYELTCQKACEKILSFGETTSGTARLSVNGQKAGEIPVTQTASTDFFGSFGVGRAYGSPVSKAFVPPFAFSGALDRVEVTLRATHDAK
jgi:arylsulfatase A-like enzyme